MTDVTQVGLMDLIEVYEVEEDSQKADAILEDVIIKVQNVERCTETVAVEFAYLLKLAKANDNRIPGKYMLQRIFGFLKLSVALNGRA